MLSCLLNIADWCLNTGGSFSITAAPLDTLEFRFRTKLRDGREVRWQYALTKKYIDYAHYREVPVECAARKGMDEMNRAILASAEEKAD